eukprot:Skav225670  [mRNA]  locus=scaffold1924:267746:268871:- [translate_table: standard]
MHALPFGSDGILEVSNTLSRKEDLSIVINRVLASQHFSVKAAASLRSRLNFADGHIFGRFAKKALRLLGEHADFSVSEVVSGDLLTALSWLHDHVLHGRPKRISVAKKKTFLLFLDGACEGEDCAQTCSIGGVLVDKEHGPVACFGEVVPKAVVDMWKERGSKQLIFEAEILPYVVALRVWAHLLRDALVLVFIDNDAARHSWVTAGAHTQHAMDMVHRALILEAELDASAYFCRVPSHSNMMDLRDSVSSSATASGLHVWRSMAVTSSSVPGLLIDVLGVWIGPRR